MTTTIAEQVSNRVKTMAAQSSNAIGAALHERFRASYEPGSPITTEHSDRSLIAHLLGEATGEIWTVTDE
jgi:hypothetical protein